jgi:phenylacetate-coenzyme A ligase PaaK-like adenylate-forming protein
MTVKVEVRGHGVDRPALEADLRRRFKDVLSATLEVEAVDPKSLDASTGLSSNSKIKRLADNRAVRKLQTGDAGVPGVRRFRNLLR